MPYPFLHFRDDLGAPPALRVTRWWQPQPMRKTLVRAPGEADATFYERAQQLALVWQITVTTLRHPFLITIECLYAVPRNVEWEDDRWAGQQAALAILSDVKTPASVRSDAIALLQELQCAL